MAAFRNAQKAISLAAEGNHTPILAKPFGRTELAPPGYARGAAVAWPIKVALKLAFGWAPRTWLNAVRVNRASHRAEEDAAHVNIPLGLCSQFEEARGRRPVSVLEFGPGGMVAQCVTFAALGANPIVLVEQTDLACRDPAPFQRAAQTLRQRGYAANDLDGVTDALAAMAACHTTYLSDGLGALRTLPDAQFDFVASSAVLEHVRSAEIEETLHHLHRVMRPDGYALHGVDLHDHFGGGLNSLRFSSAFWEHPYIAQCGLYTNRWSERQWLAGFEAAGFRIERLDRARWPQPPIAARCVHRDVDRPSDDLLTAWIVIGLGRTDRPHP
jgi:SAM-dependent methyltransferase